MVKLGVNIDHVATLRQARRGSYPDPVDAARICLGAGCDSIVAHLREDRRHINDNDIIRLKKEIKARFNLEMSSSPEIVDIACLVRPDQATLVPEKRQELTTEGGLDIVTNKNRLKKVIGRLTDCGIEVSLFIDPAPEQISAAVRLGAKIIEIHSGRYAEAKSQTQAARYLKEIIQAVVFARGLGLQVNVGHGLDYYNVKDVAQLAGVYELNIGYSIICRSLFVGLKKAVEEMLCLIA